MVFFIWLNFEKLVELESYSVRGRVAMHTRQLWVCLHGGIQKNFSEST